MRTAALATFLCVPCACSTPASRGGSAEEGGQQGGEGQEGEGEGGEGEAGEGEGEAGEGEGEGEAGEGEGEGEGGQADTPALHRPAGSQCPPERSEIRQPEGIETEGDDCKTHEDCADGINGRCIEASTGGERDPTWRWCSYDECSSDDDCEPQRVCACRGDILREGHEPWGDAAANVCMRQGNCRVDADCGADGFCSPSMGECGDYWGVVGWFCRTAEDECVNDSGCNDNDIWGPNYCAYNPAVGRWMCSDAACAG